MFLTLSIRLLFVFVLLFGLASCDRAHSKKTRRDVPHSGFRSDAPSPAKRGNAELSDPSFDPTGRWLLALTTFRGLRLWRASDGQFIKELKGSPVQGWHFTPDGDAVVVEFEKQPGYHLVSLPSGELLASIAQDGNEQRLAGLTPDGSLALVFGSDTLEFWSLESGQLEASIKGPWQPRPYGPLCTVYSGSYFETPCVAFSPDGAWLAMAYTDPGDTRNPTHYYLVDLRRREFIPIDVPAVALEATGGMLFSPDSRTLAMGVSKGLLFYDMESRSLSPVLAGQHPRNQFLIPAAFSTPRTLVALADQLEVNIVDVVERKIVRRHEPGKKYWEGTFRVSRNGARVVLYHVRGDVLEVLDGTTGERVGWVCTYYCNRPNNTFVDFAVSPNGTAVAASHSTGSAIWSTDADALLAPLFDPHRPLLKR